MTPVVSGTECASSCSRCIRPLACSGLVDIFQEVDTMSTMADRRAKRARRSFTEEFKASVVRLALDEGKSVGAAARDLDLTESSLRNWVEQARADRGTGKPGALTSAEREELTRLRKGNRILAEERERRNASAASGSSA